MYVENLVRLGLIYVRGATIRGKAKERQPVISINVKLVGYDAEEKVLEVEFKSGDVYPVSRSAAGNVHRFLNDGPVIQEDYHWIGEEISIDKK
jgi:hypothetical protein